MRVQPQYKVTKLIALAGRAVMRVSLQSNLTKSTKVSSISVMRVPLQPKSINLIALAGSADILVP